MLPDDVVRGELVRLTDWHTNEIFQLAGAFRAEAAVSRLVVDVERFREDGREPMAAAGMGSVYTRASDGQLLAIPDEGTKETLLRAHYDPHHAVLNEWVRLMLGKAGMAIIVDCHSFPSIPLSCDQDKSMPRPDFCVGTDGFHTPRVLAEECLEGFRHARYTVEENRPYSGSMVPSLFRHRDRRVGSIMIEINRALYMDESTTDRNDRFDEVCAVTRDVLKTVAQWLPLT
jgi:N-formylglutamate amidohydrolase